MGSSDPRAELGGLWGELEVSAGAADGLAPSDSLGETNLVKMNSFSSKTNCYFSLGAADVGPG